MRRARSTCRRAEPMRGARDDRRGRVPAPDTACRCSTASRSWACRSRDLTADSRTVKLGSIFVAYPGTAQDGRTYIADAIARGAAAVLWEREGFTWHEAWDVPNLGVRRPAREASPASRAQVYGNPSRIAVDGGRDRHQRQDLGVAVDRRRARCAWGGAPRSSARWATASRASASEAKNTTPDAIVLQRLLADYLRRGARNVAMEVSSHGLDQGRVARHQVRRAPCSPISRATTSTTTAPWSRTPRPSHALHRRAASRIAWSTSTTIGARARRRACRRDVITLRHGQARRGCARAAWASPRRGVRFHVGFRLGQRRSARRGAGRLQRLQPAGGDRRAARRGRRASTTPSRSDVSALRARARPPRARGRRCRAAGGRRLRAHARRAREGARGPARRRWRRAIA